METYQDAWNLRSRVNMELRRTGAKDNYTSTIIGTTMIFWRVEVYGKKTGRDVAEIVAREFVPAKMTEADRDKEWADERTKEIFDQLRQDKRDKKDTKLTKLIDGLGRGK